MSIPPSYLEATARQDWLRLVAPYVAFADYRSLCLVNHRCWSIFAPLLWANLLESASRSSPDFAQNLYHWWVVFVSHKLAHVRKSTRALVRVLDLRDSAKHFAISVSSHSQGTELPQSLSQALELLPGVRSLFLDGLCSIDLALLCVTRPRAAFWSGQEEVCGGGAGGWSSEGEAVRGRASRRWPIERDCIRWIRHQETHQEGWEHGGPNLLQLSVSGCSSQLPFAFFQSPFLSNLVFLDISGLFGSIHHMLTDDSLPSLRILKLRNRELDDQTCTTLLNHFAGRLWSLDLSGNKLTDSIIEPLAGTALPQSELRDDSRHRVEGRLTFTGRGTHSHGPFCFIRDNPRSGLFRHPERYLVDTPKYSKSPEELDMTSRIARSGLRQQRSDCRLPPRSDDAELISQLLLGARHPQIALDHRFTETMLRGLTHLSLSHNNVSSLGIDALLRQSGGHLSYFACDSMPLLPVSSSYRQIWPRGARLSGVMGREHVFRPLIASNLQVLRIHHSLVTNVPTFEMDGLSSAARTFVAETQLLSRVDRAFPLILKPDTNPRLMSLTLTCIPRRSSGVLVERLIGFLKLLSKQEGDVKSARKTYAASCPESHILRGITHLRLEFEASDADIHPTSIIDDCDAAALLNSGERIFSFFDGDRSAEPPAAGPDLDKDPKSPSQRGNGTGNGDGNGIDNDKGTDNGNDSVNSRDETTIAKPPQPTPQEPPPELDDDYPTTVTHNTHWQGSLFSLEVWAGTPQLARGNPHIKEYRRLVLDRHIREGLGPTTPSQCKVGAPADGYVFHGTWAMAVMPPQIATPRLEQVSEMYDVLDALRRFRRQGKEKHAKAERELGVGRVPAGAPHWYWHGKMEVEH